MPSELRIAYFAHSLRSDWNNGNAHFLRGLIRALGRMGHTVTCFEPRTGWSIDNLRTEPDGEKSLEQFVQLYSDLDLQAYDPHAPEELWRDRLRGTDIVILHEWNPPALAKRCFICVTTSVTSCSSTTRIIAPRPRQNRFERFGLDSFDGVLAFGRRSRQHLS